MDVIASSAGLCGCCTHAAVVSSDRGATFLRCARHDLDVAYAKYPRLPVTACAGFAARPADAGTTEVRA